MEVLSNMLAVDFFVSVFSGVLASLIVLFAAYFLFERRFQKYLNEHFDQLKEPTRQVLFERLVRETLFITTCCDRMVSFSEEERLVGEDGCCIVDAPVLNDRYHVNLGWAYMSSIHFNEQLSLFSGTLDHEKVKKLSEISFGVSQLRQTLNYLRQYDEGFIDSLDFFAPQDNDFAEPPSSSKISADSFEAAQIDFLGQEFRVIKSVKEMSDRDTIWKKYFAVNIHSLLWDATRLCLLLEDFARSMQFSVEKVEAEMREEGLEVFRIADRKSIIESKRNAIVDEGLYLVKHVQRPMKIKPQPPIDLSEG